jgi:hypothetical protein
MPASAPTVEFVPTLDDTEVPSVAGLRRTAVASIVLAP